MFPALTTLILFIDHNPSALTSSVSTACTSVGRTRIELGDPLHKANNDLVGKSYHVVRLIPPKLLLLQCACHTCRIYLG